MRILLIFILWCVPCVLYAQLQDSHFYKVADSEVSSSFNINSAWRPQVEGSFLRNHESQKRLMKIKLYGKFDWEINSTLTAEFEPYLVIEKGEIQSRFVRSESAVDMRQGFFRWQPVEGSSLQIGAINQGYLDAPLLISDQAFISSLAGYAHIKDLYEVQTILQLSMPSVVNSFNRYNEIADTPYLTSLFVYTEWLASDYYTFRGHVTGFHFSKLPAFIADQSKLYGNTVEGIGSSARFAYPYYGTQFDMSTQIRLGPDIYGSLGYNGIWNMGAPWERAWGERLYTIIDIDASKWFKFYARGEYFYNNSDTAPAYFNSEVYGHNDRQGFLLEVKTYVPKGNLEIGLRYVRSSPIRESLMLSSVANPDYSLQVFLSSRYKTM